MLPLKRVSGRAHTQPSVCSHHLENVGMDLNNQAKRKLPITPT